MQSAWHFYLNWLKVCLSPPTALPWLCPPWARSDGPGIGKTILLWPQNRFVSPDSALTPSNWEGASVALLSNIILVLTEEYITRSVFRFLSKYCRDKKSPTFCFCQHPTGRIFDGNIIKTKNRLHFTDELGVSSFVILSAVFLLGSDRSSRSQNIRLYVRWQFF